MEAALLLPLVLLHRQMQCCLGHTKRFLLEDLVKQERLSKPTNLDILPWSLQFLYHMSIHQALRGKIIRYNRNCNGTVTEPSGAPHSYLQRGHSASPVRLWQSPDDDRGRSIWSRTQPSSGVLLQWNCWSCPLLRRWTHQQLVRGHPIANYWRRHYNIPELHDEDTSWTSSWQDRQRLSDNAANTPGTYGEQPESEMEDDTSVTVETGNVSIPSQIHQLASLLHNILLSDREYNAPILEKLETPPADPNANPIQLFTAIDLAHLASHLSITSRLLPNMLRIMNWTTSRRFPTRSGASCTLTPEWVVN